MSNMVESDVSCEDHLCSQRQRLRFHVGEFVISLLTLLFTSNNATSLEEAQIGQHITPRNIMLHLSQCVQFVICCYLLVTVTR